MNEDKIIKLEFPDVIRRRPGMYVENLIDPTIILREVIDNAIDEVLIAKAATIINVNAAEGHYTVTDNGRGFPITLDPKHGVTSVELATSSLHAGGKFTNTTGSIGQNGVGIKATNALSDLFVVLSKVTDKNYNKSIPAVSEAWKSSSDKNNLYYRIEYKKGIKTKEDTINLLEGRFEEYPKLRVEDTSSTIVYFIPDSSMFESIECEVDTKRLGYLKLLAESQLKHSVEVFYNGIKQESTVTDFKYTIQGNVRIYDDDADWNERKAKADELHKPINRDIWYHVSFEFDSDLTKATPFEGSVNTLSVDRGVHVNLFQRCIMKALAEVFNQDEDNILVRGLKMSVIVSLSEAVFGSQTKKELTSIPGFYPFLVDDKIVKEIVKVIKKDKDSRTYFEDHIKRVTDYSIATKQLATKKYVKAVVKHADSNGFGGSPSNKLVDCTTTNRKEAELFICEGNSAGGTIEKVLDSRIHAVLPLRGRPMNSVSYDIESVVKNVEMLDIINSIGSGVDSFCNIKKCRYGKIIIAADADADGGVITSSILGLIAVHMRYLLEEGRVFVIDTPLYKQGETYIYPGEQDKLDKSKPYRRYKGLGEISYSDAKEVFLNPEKRRLVRITPDSLAYGVSLIDKTNPEPRRNLMREIGLLTQELNFGDSTDILDTKSFLNNL